MKTDPILAPEELLGQYTPLVYHIVSGYLANPEDRKECVNEVFFEFYENISRFDPKKGSCASYLAAIAKNKAVNYYRRNRRQEEMTAADKEPDAISMALGGGIEEEVVTKLDLEAAMAKLKPDDLDLIRKKYYEGMTIKEIADSMKLPYETVKKRHQRSIRQLRLMLLILLGILLLAGCGYIVARHLGILPGYGLNTRENTVFYRMSGPVSLEMPESGLTAEITSAVYQDGMLMVRFQVYEADGGPHLSELEEYFDGELYHNISNTYRAYLELDSQTLEAYDWYYLMNNMEDGGAGTYLVFEPQFEDQELTEIFDGSDAVTIKLTCDLVRRHSYWSEVVYTEYGQTDDVYASFTTELTLQRMGDEELENYAYEYTEENGGVVAIPRLENGELIVEIYPVQGRYGYVFPTITEHIWYHGIAGEPEPGPITVTAEDGAVLTGTRLDESQSDAIFFSEWNFGPAGPGTYTLHIPYLLKLYADETMFTIPIDIKNCVPDNKTYKFKGGSFRIVNIEPMTWDDVEAGNYPEVFIPEYYYNEDYEDENVLNPFTDADLLWKIDIETTLDMPDETLAGISMSVTRDKSQSMPEGNVVFPVLMDYPEDGRMSYLIIWLEGSRYRDLPPYDDILYIQMRGFEYIAIWQLGNGHVARWDHEFNLELKVEQ